MVTSQSGIGIKWLRMLANQVGLKAYFMLCGLVEELPDQRVINYFRNKKCQSLLIKILNINTLVHLMEQSVKIKSIFYIFFHYSFKSTVDRPKLIEIDLSNQQIPGNVLAYLFKELSKLINKN